ASTESPQDDDQGEDVSEEEEAADLLVYFHARSGGESNAVDDSMEVPGDEPRSTRAMSGSSVSSSPAVVAREMLRKRKRNEADEDFARMTVNPAVQSGDQVAGIGSGNILPKKSDGAGTAKEVGKGLYS